MGHEPITGETHEGRKDQIRHGFAHRRGRGCLQRRDHWQASGGASGIYHAYTDQGSDVPGVAGWNEPAARQTYAATHQFIADAFAGKL
jgi:hypothetical protein